MGTFFRGCAKFALYAFIGLAAYLLLSNVEKETAYWLIGVAILFAVNYEIQTLKEKVESLQYTVDRLSEG